jgi:hypothetical protein
LGEDGVDRRGVARRAVCRFADRVWLAAAQDPVRAACGGCRAGRLRPGSGDARAAAGCWRSGMTCGGVAA